MHKENKDEFDLSNLTHWHERGYTGKGIKIASPENLKTGHGYQTKMAMLQSAPDITIVDFDYTKWNQNFPKFIDDCIEQEVDIIMNALHFKLEEADKQALEKAAENGIIFVNAIGNEGSTVIDKSDNKSVDIRYYEPYIFQVGAVIPFGKDKKIERVNYSNKGKTLDYVEFTDIYTSDNTKFTGTSCSTPFFAGKLACMLQFYYAHDMMDYMDFMEFVDGNLLDLGEVGRDDLYGKGFLKMPDLSKWESEEMGNVPSMIIIHHTATTTGTFEAIKKYHIETKKFVDFFKKI
jgi:hypothetical protein